MPFDPGTSKVCTSSGSAKRIVSSKRLRRARHITIKKVLGEYRPERTPTHDNYVGRSEAGTRNSLFELIANVMSEYFAREIGIPHRCTHWHRVSPWKMGSATPYWGSSGSAFGGPDYRRR
jgi:hypothetical protein